MDGINSELQAGTGRSVATGKARCRFPQTRALEVNFPTDFQPADSARLVWLVKRAGFNTILLNCFRHGHTAFPSQTMRAYGFPRQHPRFVGNDPVAPFLAEARREGMTTYALVEALCVGDGPGRRRGPILRRRPDWGVRGRDRSGRSFSPPYLCAANRDVQRFLGDLFHETLEGYGFQGLYVRHLHYPLERPGQRADFCRCHNCHRAVWHSLGVRIPEIPDDPDHPDRYNLTSWRSEQLTGLLRYLRLRVGKASERALVLAETYLDGSDESPQPERFGYVDGCSWAHDQLVPMAVFRPLPDRSEGDEKWIQRIVAMTQCALVMPVLSASPASPLIGTLQRLALEPIAGIVVCEPYDLTAPPLTQLLRGPWRQPSLVTEDQPTVSVCALLAETKELLGPDNPVRAFLADVLRILEPLAGQWSPTQRESLHENLLGLEDRIADERIVLGDVTPAVVRNFRLARQLLRLVEAES